MSVMNFSLCIVHFHAEDHLRRFLTSVVSHPPQGSFEIIVADNGSSADKMDALQQEFPQVQWLRMDRNIGFGAALNRAVKEAKGDFVLLANPDLMTKQGSLQQLIDFFDGHAQAGIVGPKLVFENGKVQDSARKFPTVWSLLQHRLGFKEPLPDVASPVDWLVGAALLMRRDVFLKLGGFDERFFLFFEDTDLCRRVKEAGYEAWYSPDSIFVHTEKRLSESDWPLLWLFKREFWIHVISAIKYFWKWGL